MSNPRGIRNNNPGNIRVGQDWRGEARGSELTPEQKNETEFEVYVSPEWGIRAMVMLLKNYFLRRDLNTVEEIITRWAPPSDGNDTVAYIRHVARYLGVEPNTPIDVLEPFTAKRLVKAIIQHENNQQPYSEAVIDEGIKLAGIAVDEPAIPGQYKLAGQLRHVLTALAGVLVAKGVIDASLVEPLIGLALYVFGAAWSYFDPSKKVGYGDEL